MNSRKSTETSKMDWCHNAVLALGNEQKHLENIVTVCITRKMLMMKYTG